MTHWSLGLIGYPLSHSLSPGIHQAALDYFRISGEYALYPLELGPNLPANLSELMRKVKEGKIHGLNVTIPYKQEVIGYLEQLTPVSQAIQAVNTIYCDQAGRLTGDSTDVEGFWLGLLHSLPGVELTEGNEHRRALVLGAGGSARAVVYCLRKRGWQVTVAARKVEQARRLIETIMRTDDEHATLSATSLNLEGLTLGAELARLVVNTTPVGMWPNTSASPWPEHLDFPPGGSVFDLVYNPEQTLLVRQARKAGLAAATGMRMLLEQAALSFERWTGLKPPVEILSKSD